MFTALFKRLPTLDQSRMLRLEHEAKAQRLRAVDPMLDYWNADVIWVLADVNMGPGGEYFTGVEVLAMWNHPEEPLHPDGVIQRAITNFTYFSTSLPPVKYSQSDYRLVALGLLPAVASRLVALRNFDVLKIPLPTAHAAG